MMGVVNITPNSFSDGGLNLNHQSILKKIQDFLKTDEFSIIDFGFESTAPMNDVIDLEVEMQRVQEYFFPLVSNLVAMGVKRISIDTYKVSVMRSICEYFKAHNIAIKLYWNDVSGVLDHEALSLLKDFKNLNYIYCHNLSSLNQDSLSEDDLRKMRLVGSRHLNFIDDSFNSIRLKSFFQKGLSLLKNSGIELSRIALDPCFGFAKTHEQNLCLLEEFNLYCDVHSLWVIGISKKSFLRKLADPLNKLSKDEVFLASEAIHVESLQSLLNKCQKSEGVSEITFRVHNPSIFQLLSKSF